MTRLTQNQLHELLDSEQARALLDAAEERGYLEAPELEAFALEHELGEVEHEELARELERIGIEVRDPETPAAEGKPSAPVPAVRASPVPYTTSPKRSV